MWNAWRLKIFVRTKSVVFVAILVETPSRRSVSLIFACEDSKKLLSCFCGGSFQFNVEKCPQGAEDAEVSELCGSAPPHPVRCPVTKSQN